MLETVLIECLASELNDGFALIMGKVLRFSV